MTVLPPGLHEAESSVTGLALACRLGIQVKAVHALLMTAALDIEPSIGSPGMHPAAHGCQVQLGNLLQSLGPAFESGLLQPFRTILRGRVSKGALAPDQWVASA